MTARSSLVSFVMPVWEPRPEWLLQAVQSVLGQRDCELELIVVDDGNRKPVANLLEGVRDARLEVIRVDHGGPSRARNAGTAVARGDFLRFVDSDDVIEAQSTAHLLHLVGERPGFFSYGASQICDEDLRPLWKMSCGREGRLAIDSLLGRFTIRTHALLFPRSVVEAAGEWDEGFETAEDWDFITRAAEHAEGVGDRRIVAYYRRHAGSITGRAKVDTTMGDQAARRVVKRFFERHPEARGTGLEREAMARIHATAARRHATHGELGPSLRRLGRSFALDPRAVLEEVGQGLPALLGYARYRRSASAEPPPSGSRHFRLVRLAYQAIAASPLSPLLRSRLVQRLKRKLVKIPPELVPQVMRRLEEAGIEAWLAGGWGIDALLGLQTRPHLDMDIAFLDEGDADSRAVEALRPLGFHFIRREANPGRWLSARVVLSDDAGHLLELLPVALCEGQVAVRVGDDTLTFAAREAFASGTVDGDAVRCLSAALQAALHHDYDITDNDRLDMAALCERFDLPVPFVSETPSSPVASSPLRETA
jgi:lincosamide nucleotidyltransferase A/C/D/E